MTEKTIDNHVGNVDFYINKYLLYEDAVDPKIDDMGEVWGF